MYKYDDKDALVLVDEIDRGISILSTEGISNNLAQEKGQM